MTPTIPCLVSIIVPAYNAGPYLRRCVESVLEQNHQQIELIVVDDCSSDDTADILNEISAKDSRLKVVHLEDNMGVHGARSRGVALARGKFLAFADADDWLAPGMISALLAEATSGQGADIVICGAVLATAIGQMGRHKVRFHRRKVIEDCLLERFCRPEFGTGVPWNKPYRTHLIRPYALLSLERKVDAAEDYIVNIGCFAKADRVVVVPQTYYFYFVHPESASRSTTNAKSFSRTLRAYVVCLETYLDSLGANLDLITGLYSRQLMLSCYRVQSTADLTPVRDELSESLERLARVHPEGAYSLVHVFDHAGALSSIRLRPALRRLFTAVRDVAHACANHLAEVRRN